ncbi:MAG: hypothetical protein H6842_06365 [Rhodospirillaceae bacterium]|nr:hypothetical protein [Rhodospirillaceae bacterium]
MSWMKGATCSVLPPSLPADDEIDAILALLAGEHTADERQADIVTGLEGLIAGRVAADSDRGGTGADRLCRRQRRRSAGEQLVLPMARVRLTARDLQGMAKADGSAPGCHTSVKPLR